MSENQAEEEFLYGERPDFYRRKRDGARVRAADWPDGDVTWVLDPIPIIGGRFAGTCSAKTFSRNHVMEEGRG